MRRLTIVLALTLAIGAALPTPHGAAAEPLVADDDRIVMTRVDQSAEDSEFSLEQAIIGAGLTIDYHSHVGDMLARTRADVGSEVKLFVKADIFVFCSAALSREMMEADITSVALCPYSMFVFERPEEPDVSYIGYRRLARDASPTDSPLRKIDALLNGIMEEAASF